MATDERTFDIFKTLPDGSPLWVEAVQGVDNARQRLIQLQEISSDKYRVYDASGHRFVDILSKTA